MATLVGSIMVSLGLDSGTFSSGLDASAKKMKATQAKFTAIGSKIATAGAVMSAAITAPLVALVTKSIPAAIESQQALAQVNAALASMGPVAGRTSDQLVKMAGHLQDISLFDDDDILKKVTANLLTFGKVTGETFDRAQVAAVNLSARLGQDLQSSAIQLGKALNDPVKGVTALQRVGVSFTTQQREQIKTMVAAGNTAGAQSIILKELEKQFGGAAKAQRDATPGADVQQQWRTFQETLGGIALKVLPPLNDGLAKLLGWFNNLSPQGQTTAVWIAGIAAAAGPVTVALGGIVTVFGKLLPFLTGGGIMAEGGALALLAPEVLIPLAAAAGAVYLAFEKWPQLTKSIDALVNRLKTAKAEFDGLLNGIDQRLGSTQDSAFNKKYRADLQSFLNYDIGKGLETAINGAIAWLGKLGTSFVKLQGDAINAMNRMVSGISQWIVGKLNVIWDGVKAKIDTVKGWFFGLYDAVVGHSYIPDMVDEIGQNIARLDGNMVLPVQAATTKAADAFKKLRDDVSGVLDRLFPEQSQIRDKLNDLDELGKAFAQKIISEDQFRAARTRVMGEIEALQDEIADKGALKNINLTTGNENNGPDVQAITTRTAEMGLATIAAGNKVRAANDNIIESYADMTASVARSLSDLVSDIKRGDWLSALESVANAISKIGGALSGAGVNFGGSSSSSASASHGANTGVAVHGARALGGPVLAGRNYIVGERGPELFSPRASGMIVPNSQLGSGGRQVNIDLRGSVTTADLLVQMQAIANDTGGELIGRNEQARARAQARRLR